MPPEAVELEDGVPAPEVVVAVWLGGTALVVAEDRGVVVMVVVEVVAALAGSVKSSTL